MGKKKSKSPKKAKAAPLHALSQTSRVLFAQVQGTVTTTPAEFYAANRFQFAYKNRVQVHAVVKELSDAVEVKVHCEEEGNAFSHFFHVCNSLKFLSLTLPPCPSRLLLDHLKYLFSLEELSITGRSLFTEEIYTLADSLLGLQTLKSLSFRNCGIKTERLRWLARTISGLMELRKVDLSGNELEEQAFEALMEIFSTLKNLKHIDLSNNYLTSFSLSYLCPIVGEKCAISSLDFSHNNAIKQSGGKSLMRMFGNPKIARCIWLDSTPLDESSFQHLGALLPKMERLEELSLSHTNCNNVAIVYLTNHIDQLTKLRVLRLKTNKIGTQGIKKLASKLPTLSNLEELHLRDNVFSTEAGQILAMSFTTLVKLQRLRLGLNIINEASGTAIFEALQNCPLLTHLEVTLGGLHKDCAVALAQNVSPRLQSLSLRESRLEPDGALYLSEALVRFRELKRLNLSRCLIREEGSCYIAGAIVTLQSLHTLKLWYNFMHTEGLASLCVALQNMPALTYLDVSDNIIDNSGAFELCKVLPCLPNLRTLDVRMNSLTLSGVRACICAVNASSQKCDIRVEENSIDPEDIMSIRRKCADCGHKCQGIKDVCAWERRKVVLSVVLQLRARSYKWGV